MAECAGSGDLT